MYGGVGLALHSDSDANRFVDPVLVRMSKIGASIKASPGGVARRKVIDFGTKGDKIQKLSIRTKLHRRMKVRCFHVMGPSNGKGNEMRMLAQHAHWILAAVIACVGASAGAQQAPDVVPGQKVRTLSLIAGLGYDDNVARSSAAVAAARGIKPSDEIFRPSVRLALAQPFGRQSLFLNATTGYDFYRVNPVLNRERLSFDGGAATNFGPCSQTFSGSYSRSQSDLALLALNNVVTSVRNLTTSKSVGVNGSCGRSIGFAETFGVSEDWESNSSNALSPGSKTFTLSGGLAYRRPSFGSLSTFGSYSRTLFDKPSFLPPNFPFSNGFKLYAGGVTYARRVGARLSGSASVSYSQLSPDAVGSIGFRGLTYSFTGNYAVSQRLQGMVKFSRHASPSTRIGGTFSIDQTLLGEIDYALGRRWNLKLGASRIDNDYRGNAISPGTDLTKQTLDTIFGSASYRLLRHVTVSLNVSHDQRDANLSGFTYASNKVGLTASTSF